MDNKNLIQSIFNWALLDMKDESNPFVKLAIFISSLLQHSSSSTLKQLESILEISSLVNSNYTLMNNRLIDFQSTFENKFVEFASYFTSSFSNLHNNMNSQSELLSPLNTNYQNLLILMEKIESTLHVSMEKSYQSLSYISSEKFIEKISMCFDLLLKADLLDTNNKMYKILENLSAISITNEERSNLREMLESISFNTNKISQNQLISSDNLTHFSTLLNNLSNLQHDHFNLLLTKSFSDNWNDSFQDYLSNNFRELNKIMTTNFQNIELTHTSFAENIFTLLNNIPSLEVIKPF
jgi:hypothetical protein